jgi:hypothetical protein
MTHGFASDASVAAVAAEPKGPPKLAGTARKRPLRAVGIGTASETESGGRLAGKSIGGPL